MYSKIQLKEHLEEISNGAKFIKFDFSSPEKFTIILKCKIEDEKEAAYYHDYSKQWVRKFAAFTNTTWNVRTCFSNMKRMAFRKSFCCHRSSHNKIKTIERTRNSDCKARIDFRIKFITRHTKRHDPDLKEGLNMSITVTFNHSHLVNAAESFNMLKSSSKSDAAFCEYFNDGYTPAAAKHYHELLLTERYGRESEHIANASVNPHARHVIYIFHKNKKNNNVETDVIQRKINTLQQSHTIKYNNEPQFIVIVTPLMGRVLTQFSIDHVLVDVTPCGELFVMFVYVPTRVGSLPIACAIYMDLSEATYGTILLSVSSAIENYAKGFQPELVTVNDLLLKDALNSMFPNIVVKLDRRGICRDFWEWTCDSENNIDKDIRHDIMVLFKSLIYANTIEDATEIYDDLLNNSTMKNCLNKLESVWKNREQWITNEDITGNSVEGTILFVKEFLIQKCKSFNFATMIDIVTNILENHFQKIILASLDNEVTEVYTKFLPKANIQLSSESTQSDQNEFIVPCLVDDQVYRVNTETLCCDCRIGKKGRICEHLTAVLNVTNTKYTFQLSEEDKVIFLKISGKLVIVKHEFDGDVEILDRIDDIGDSNETPIADRPNSASLDEESDYEIKIEETYPLDEKDKHMATEPDLKAQYETAMRALNDEFRRLNQLFKDNPNEGNMATMVRMAKELAKIIPVATADFSSMSVQLNP